MEALQQQFTSLQSSLAANSIWLLVLDILLVAFLVYWFLVFIKETRALRLLTGLIIIAILYVVGRWLDLQTLNLLMKGVAAVTIVAIPVIFQSELRTLLERIGKTTLLSSKSIIHDEDVPAVVEVLVRSTADLSSKSIGALIVLARQDDLTSYVESGVTIKGQLSAELIGSLFGSKSPLREGAVIINGRVIESASSILPLAELEDEKRFGTRHRAGLGVATFTDAVAIIISEESGQISIARHGKLKVKVSINQLREELLKILIKQAV